MSALPDPLQHRNAMHPIEALLLRRWSPRAMSGAAVAGSDLMRLFEAARWAPSTHNEQGWRFLYADKGGADWALFFDLLTTANQSWCGRAGALIVGLSCTVFSRNGRPNPVHTLDCGLAVQNLLLQGAAMGLVCHPMAGFDRDRARLALAIPEQYDVEVMIAVGHPGAVDDLPEQYRAAERTPSDRKPIETFVLPGRFAF